MIRALLLLAIATTAATTAALPAAAQQTPPVEPKKEPERRPLNLQLDNPSSFATIRPAEKAPEKSLPALGGDARNLVPAKREGTGPGGPFPQNTQ